MTKVKFDPILGRVREDDKLYVEADFGGKAVVATDPGTPTAAVFYICTETGTYTNFDNQAADVLDRFYWNTTTSAWDLIPYEQSYIQFVNTDPDGVGTPASGKVFVGNYAGKLWIKDENDVVEYYARLTDVKKILFGNSYAVDKERQAIDDGGTVFPNSAGYTMGYLELMGLRNNVTYLFKPFAHNVSKAYPIKPFANNYTATRTTVGYYIDEDGFLKMAAINTPRISFDSQREHLLLEHSSENLFLNSDTLVSQDVTTLADTYTVSFYGTGTITFSGSYSGSLVGTGVNDKVELTFTATAGTLTCTVSGSVLYAQCEKLAYSTSYYKTTGSTATRGEDSVLNATADINSEEGSLVITAAALYNTLSNRNITISDGTNNNRIQLQYGIASNTIYYYFIVGGSIQASGSYAVSDITDYHNIIITWKQDDFALWIDGVKRAGDTSGNVPAAGTFTQTDFATGLAGDKFFGKVATKYIVNRKLTDLEIKEIYRYELQGA